MSIKLLPKSLEEFSTKKYWDDFFTKRRAAFEWYGDYVDLCDVLHVHCQRNNSILMIGCGSSKLSEDMYDIGYTNITNIDISEVVIKQMTMRNKNRAKMKYLKMDITQCAFADSCFDVVFDKGTLDAIFTDTNESTLSNVKKMFCEIERVIQLNGVYLCVSLAQPHIVKELLAYFTTTQNWTIKVHKIITNSQSDKSGLGHKLPVFVFAFMKTTGADSILEKVALVSPGAVEDFESINQLIEAIKCLQDLALVQHKLETSTLDEPVTFDVFQQHSEEPRYTLTLIDTAKRSFLSDRNGCFAVFIVPQGQETDISFSSLAAKQHLATLVGYDRLAVVALHRLHVYKDVQQIQDELSGKVLDFAPKHMDNSLVPFLTSNGLGTRELRLDAHSIAYGRVFVEDFQSNEGFFYRQFLFENDLSKVQCKARLMMDKSSKKRAKSKRRIVDHRYLVTSYSKAILSGLTLISSAHFHDGVKLRCLFYGLQWTCLSGFLLKLFPEIELTIVEDDPVLLETVDIWFDLRPSCGLKIVENPFALHEKDFYDMIVSNHSPNESLENDINNALRSTGVYVCSTNETASYRCQSFETISCCDGDDQINICYGVPKRRGAKREELMSLSKQKASELRDFLHSSRKDFYEKKEWIDLDVRT